MSFRDWLHNAALRGCLIAALVVVSFGVLGQENQSQQSAQTPEANSQQQQPAPPLPVTVVGPVSLEREKAVEADWSKPNCAKPQNHDEADLCQQGRMAKAAEDTVWLNSLQIGIGILTIIGLAFTVHYTRKTANAAIIASEAAELSAKAAIGIELPVIRCESQPFLTNVAQPPSEEHPFRGGMGTRNPGRYSVVSSLTFSNHGRTPAFPIMLAVGWKVIDDLPREPTYDQVIQSSATAIINPGETFTAAARAVIELSDDQRNRIREQTSTLWLYVALHYRDFLNLHHEARFYWRFNPTNGFVGGSKEHAAYTKHA